MSAPYYEARHGLVWSPVGVRSVREAEAFAKDFLDMAITERDGAHAACWVRQLGSLILAIREAKAQEAAAPVRLAA